MTDSAGTLADTGKGLVVTGVRGNVADLVSTAAQQHPTAVALIDTVSGRTLTWAGLDAAVNALVRALSQVGVRAGDRVALRLPTSPAFAIGFFAVLRAGGVAVPLSPQAPAAEAKPVLEHSGARVLLGPPDAGLGPDLTVLDPDPGAHGDPVGDPVADDTAAGGADDTAAGGADDTAAGGAEQSAASGGEDTAVLLYTSGTTGPSRGVMLSHRALLANVEQLRSLRPPVVEHGDRVFIAIPLHHVYGLGPGLLTTAAAGASAVLSPRFDARQALAHCAAHRVTVLLGVPGMYTDFAALPADEVGEQLSTARLLISGAAPLRPKVLAAMRAATGLPVYEGYGLTEAAPVVTFTLVTGYAKPGSVGRPLPGVELCLVDSDGSGEVVPLDPADPDDAFGEDEAGTGLVAIRGENLFSGYWPDGAHGPDAEGWLRTGDIGYLDTDGDLHLIDRTGDLIIVNGFNVYPHEVEQVIAELPQVAEVAVIGVLDERSGEAVRAVVVPEQGAALSEQQVLRHCAERLAGYKVPTSLRFVSELPRSPTGKPRRVELRP